MKSEFGVAILRAIEQSSLELTGSTVVDPQVARDSMVLTLASLIEAKPGIESDDDMIDAARTMAADLFAYAKSLRANFERTGQRAWASLAPREVGSYTLQ